MTETNAFLEALEQTPAEDGGETATTVDDGQTGGDVSEEQSAPEGTGETKTQREIELEQKVARLTKLLGNIPAKPEGSPAPKPSEPKPEESDFKPYVGRIQKAFADPDQSKGIEELLLVVDELSAKRAAKVAEAREAERAQATAATTAAQQLRQDWNTVYPDYANVSDELLRAALTEVWKESELRFKDNVTKADTLQMFKDGKSKLESWGIGKARVVKTAQVGTTPPEPQPKAPARGAQVARKSGGDLSEQDALNAMLSMGDVLRPKRP